jgi:hypothetical protein
MGETRNACNLYFETPKVLDQFGDIGVDGRIMLK